MHIRQTRAFLYGIICLLVLSLVVGTFFILKTRGVELSKVPGHQVLGMILAPTNTPTPTVTPIPPTPTPTIWVPEVHFNAMPADMNEDDRANFSWAINGPDQNISSTSVYYGTVSVPGILTTSAAPTDTAYKLAIPDFMKGQYHIPLQFSAGVTMTTPGTYFYRGYAQIDGKHYWTEEKLFTVKVVPKHEVNIISQPTTISPGSIASFTWDVLGPEAKFGFTTIVAGTVSKPGPLDVSISTTMTPYTIRIQDFTNGSYVVPFRFTGNAQFTDPGVYFFRAIGYVNDKNIWSEEYSFTVQ